MLIESNRWTLMRIRSLAAALLALAFALPCAAHAAPAAVPKREVVIGLIPEMNVFRQKARFRSLGEHLGRQVGVPVRFTILSRYGNVLESFEAERMDGAFFGSFTGALAVARLAVIPLARPVNLDGSSTYRGRIFVRKDSGIRGVADMRGKRMALVDRATTAGYVFPLAWLREHGVARTEGFFAETFFTGSHDAAVDAVLGRRADVGAAKDSVYARLRVADPRVDAELVVLADSPSVPSNGLCVRKDLDPALREGLRRALLDLERAPGGKEILAELGALRFVETRSEDYAPVADLSAKAGIDVAKYEYRND
jgi:phosphonate transport system substrate-binding protein